MPSSTSLEHLAISSKDQINQPLYAPPAVRMTSDFRQSPLRQSPLRQSPLKSPIQYPGIQLSNTPRMLSTNSSNPQNRQKPETPPILSPNSKLRRSLRNFHKKLHKPRTTKTENSSNFQANSPVKVLHSKSTKNDAVGARLANFTQQQPYTRTTGSQLTSQHQKQQHQHAEQPLTLMPPTLQITHAESTNQNLPRFNQNSQYTNFKNSQHKAGSSKVPKT